ncbi:MAG: response regulator [Chlorobiaceae bacterium]
MIILIAEDDEVSRLLLLTSLKNANITTLSAVNGQEAVIMVEQHPEINLVLMDVKMPLMNGYEATTLIKKIRPYLPVIVQTAFTSKEERQKAQDAGCYGFITKPVNNDELFALIKKVLNN